MTVAVTVTGRVFTEAFNEHALVMVSPETVQAVPKMSVSHCWIENGGALDARAPLTLNPEVANVLHRRGLAVDRECGIGNRRPGRVGQVADGDRYPTDWRRSQRQRRTESFGRLRIPDRTRNGGRTADTQLAGRERRLGSQFPHHGVADHRVHGRARSATVRGRTGCQPGKPGDRHDCENGKRLPSQFGSPRRCSLIPAAAKAAMPTALSVKSRHTLFATANIDDVWSVSGIIGGAVMG